MYSQAMIPKKIHQVSTNLKTTPMTPKIPDAIGNNGAKNPRNGKYYDTIVLKRVEISKAPTQKLEMNFSALPASVLKFAAHSDGLIAKYLSI